MVGNLHVFLPLISYSVYINLDKLPYSSMQHNSSLSTLVHAVLLDKKPDEVPIVSVTHILIIYIFFYNNMISDAIFLYYAASRIFAKQGHGRV